MSDRSKTNSVSGIRTGSANGALELYLAKPNENSDTLKNVNENLHVALNVLKLYVKNCTPYHDFFGGNCKNWCKNKRKRPARLPSPQIST